MLAARDRQRQMTMSVMADWSKPILQKPVGYVRVPAPSEGLPAGYQTTPHPVWKEIWERPGSAPEGFFDVEGGAYPTFLTPIYEGEDAAAARRRAQRKMVQFNRDFHSYRAAKLLSHATATLTEYPPRPSQNPLAALAFGQHAGLVEGIGRGLQELGTTRDTTEAFEQQTPEAAAAQDRQAFLLSFLAFPGTPVGKGAGLLHRNLSTLGRRGFMRGLASEGGGEFVRGIDAGLVGGATGEGPLGWLGKQLGRLSRVSPRLVGQFEQARAAAGASIVDGVHLYIPPGADEAAVNTLKNLLKQIKQQTGKSIQIPIYRVDPRTLGADRALGGLKPLAYQEGMKTAVRGFLQVPEFIAGTATASAVGAAYMVPGALFGRTPEERAAYAGSIPEAAAHGAAFGATLSGIHMMASAMGGPWRPPQALQPKGTGEAGTLFDGVPLFSRENLPRRLLGRPDTVLETPFRPDPEPPGPHVPDPTTRFLSLEPAQIAHPTQHLPTLQIRGRSGFWPEEMPDEVLEQNIQALGLQGEREAILKAREAAMLANPILAERTEELQRVAQALDDPKEVAKLLRGYQALRSAPPPVDPQMAEGHARALLAWSAGIRDLVGQDGGNITRILGFDYSPIFRPGTAPEIAGPTATMARWAAGVLDEAQRAGIDLEEALAELPLATSPDPMEQLGIAPQRIQALADRVRAQNPAAAVGPPEEAMHLPEDQRTSPPVRLQTPSAPRLPDPAEVSVRTLPDPMAFDADPPGAARLQAYSAMVLWPRGGQVGYLRAHKPEHLLDMDSPVAHVRQDSRGRLMLRWSSPDQMGTDAEWDVTEGLHRAALPAEADWEWISDESAGLPYRLDSDTERLVVDKELAQERQWIRDIEAESLREAFTQGRTRPDADPISFIESMQQTFPATPELQQESLLRLREFSLQHLSRVPTRAQARSLVGPDATGWELQRAHGDEMQRWAFVGTMLEAAKTRVLEALAEPAVEELALQSLINTAEGMGAGYEQELSRLQAEQATAYAAIPETMAGPEFGRREPTPLGVRPPRGPNAAHATLTARGQARQQETRLSRMGFSPGGGRRHMTWDTPEQRGYAPEFYSKLRRVVEGSPAGTWKVEDLRRFLRNSGVQKAEMEWVFDPAMQGKDTLTKEEALSLIAENEIRIEEKMLTEGGNTEALQWTRDANDFGRTDRPPDLVTTDHLGKEHRVREWRPVVSFEERSSQSFVEERPSQHIGTWRDPGGQVRFSEITPSSSGDFLFDDPYGSFPHRAGTVQEAKNRIQQLVGGYFIRSTDSGSWSGPFSSEQEAKIQIQARIGGTATGQTQFNQWRVPGGDPGTYREWLLRLPDKRPRLEDASEASRTFQEQMAKKYGADVELLMTSPAKEGLIDQADIMALIDRRKAEWDRLREKMTPEERAEESRLLLPIQRASGRREGPIGSPQYVEPHFNEPDVFADVRMDDRTLPDGRKRLFLHEIQSQWTLDTRAAGVQDPAEITRLEGERTKAEDAREKAITAWRAAAKKHAEYLGAEEFYSKTPWEEVSPAALRAVVNQAAEQNLATVDLAAGPREEVPPEYKHQKGMLLRMRKAWSVRNELRDLEAKYNDAVAQERDIVSALHRQRGLPSDFPFRNNWMEVVLKKVLRYAAEHGYDEVGWSTGQQVADMYDLREYIDRLEFQPGTVGEPFPGILTVKMLNGQTERITMHNQRELDTHVGKELRNRLLADRIVEEDGLELGGEWADKLYDGINPKTGEEVHSIPTFLRKYGKKWGIELKHIPADPKKGKTGDSVVRHFFKITKAMTDAVLKKGQALYGPGAATFADIQRQQFRTEAWSRMAEGEGFSKHHDLWEVLRPEERFHALRIRISKGPIRSGVQFDNLHPAKLRESGIYGSKMDLTDGEYQVLKEAWETRAEELKLGKKMNGKLAKAAAARQRGEVPERLGLRDLLAIQPHEFLEKFEKNPMEALEFTRQFWNGMDAIESTAEYEALTTEKQQTVERYFETLRQAAREIEPPLIAAAPHVGDLPPPDLGPNASNKFLWWHSLSAHVKQLLRVPRLATRSISPPAWALMRKQVAHPGIINRMRQTGEFDDDLFNMLHKGYHDGNRWYSETHDKFTPLWEAALRLDSLDKAIDLRLELQRPVSDLTPEERIFTVNIRGRRGPIAKKIDLGEWIPKEREWLDDTIARGAQAQVQIFGTEVRQHRSNLLFLDREVKARELAEARRLAEEQGAPPPERWSEIEDVDAVRKALRKQKAPGAGSIGWFYGAPKNFGKVSYKRLETLVAAERKAMTSKQEDVDFWSDPEQYYIPGYHPRMYRLLGREIEWLLNDPTSPMKNFLSARDYNRFMEWRKGSGEMPVFSYTTWKPLYMEAFKRLIFYRPAAQAVRGKIGIAPGRPEHLQQGPSTYDAWGTPYVYQLLKTMEGIETPFTTMLNRAMAHGLMQEPTFVDGLRRLVRLPEKPGTYRQMHKEGMLSERPVTQAARDIAGLTYLGFLDPNRVSGFSFSEKAFWLLNQSTRLRDIPIGLITGTYGAVKALGTGSLELLTWLGSFFGMKRWYSAATREGMVNDFTYDLQKSRRFGTRRPGAGTPIVSGLLHSAQTIWFTFMRFMEYYVRTGGYTPSRERMKRLNPDLPTEEIARLAGQEVDNITGSFGPMDVSPYLQNPLGQMFAALAKFPINKMAWLHTAASAASEAPLHLTEKLTGLPVGRKPPQRPTAAQFLESGPGQQGIGPAQDEPPFVEGSEYNFTDPEDLRQWRTFIRPAAMHGAAFPAGPEAAYAYAKQMGVLIPAMGIMGFLMYLAFNFLGRDVPEGEANPYTLPTVGTAAPLEVARLIEQYAQESSYAYLFGQRDERKLKEIETIRRKLTDKFPILGPYWKHKYNKDQGMNFNYIPDLPPKVIEGFYPWMLKETGMGLPVKKAGKAAKEAGKKVRSVLPEVVQDYMED